jgi:ApbE superfamily uncharacterized protein (UPF0280 family)
VTFERRVALINDESVLAECGPMRLMIRAFRGGRAQIDMAYEAACRSFGVLSGIAMHRSILSLLPAKIRILPRDDLALRMIASVNSIGDNDLTPMAAVAGTIADALADWLFAEGASKVIVDNGGDIAVRLGKGEIATVGIRPRLGSYAISHVITLSGNWATSWGITTSGMGGRSFTRGIASAATVLATNASIADAASSAVANACFVEDDNICQVPAEQIDPNSDLVGVLVTKSIGPISSAKRAMAVDRARGKANNLSRRGIIMGAFIAVDSIFAITDGMGPYISSTSRCGV